jgi:hypothetical protein
MEISCSQTSPASYGKKQPAFPCIVFGSIRSVLFSPFGINKMRLILLCIVGISLLGACREGSGGYRDTTRKVEESDITGVWHYDTRGNGRQFATLELDEQGVFTITGSAENSGTGHWNLANNYLGFDYVDRPKFHGGWYVAEDHDANLIIVGSDLMDPDFWSEMKRIR